MVNDAEYPIAYILRSLPGAIMGMTVKTTPRQSVLHVAAKGSFTLDSAMQTFLEIVKALDQHNCERILFDARSLTGEPSIIERFYYGEFVADAVMRPGEHRAPLKNPQFAYVMLPPVLDVSRLGETVAANRGMNVRAFDNMVDAAAWLGFTSEDIDHVFGDLTNAFERTDEPG